jgi:transcription elongation GreA/GreB family factor
MGQIKLTENAYHNLLHHLVEMESRQSLVEDEWVTDIKEKEALSLFFHDYLHLMSDTINKISVQPDAANNEFPFAAIGCLVKIQDIDHGNTFEVKIVPPYQERIDFDDVSILSPMGKALLKKGIGECVHVQAPGGEYRYKILAINCLEQ